MGQRVIAVANDGLRHFPINIITKEAKYDTSLKPLKLRYPSNAKGILINGHSFQVDYVDNTDSSSEHRSALGVSSSYLFTHAHHIFAHLSNLVGKCYWTAMNK
uniref:Alpha-carbonic anhydrase domain-containing protein n=1 Tax=Anabas testudineus TaxID=64144 RepID=A0A3Q1IZS3_ANATE